MFAISTMLALSHVSAAFRTMTEATPSRRLVVKGLLAAIAGGVPVSFGLDPVAARRRRRRGHKKHKKGKGGTGHKPLSCNGDSCDGTGGKSCGGRDTCQCYRWAKGGNVCASSLQSSCEATCEADHNCPPGHVCVEGGPACCGNGVRFCKQACY
jgi:hypothetical protein